MTITFQNKTLISGTVVQTPTGTTTQGTIGTYDLATGGPGGNDAGDKIVIAIARINEHSETSSLKTHGYIEQFGLFTYLGGTLVGPILGVGNDVLGGIFIESISDTGNAANCITFSHSGTQILISATVNDVENGTGTFSGILEIYLVD